MPARTQDGSGWLALSGGAIGNTPGSLVVSVINYTTLKPATYSGSIVIASQAPNSPLVVQVTLTVVAAPSMHVTPPSLTFRQPVSSGSSVSQQAVGVSSSGASLSFNAASLGGAWLSVRPESDQTPRTLNVIVDSGGLTEGIYQGSILISSSAANNPVSVPVTMIVGSPALLSVSPLLLRFEHREGEASPPAQTLAVSSPVAAAGWSAGATTASGGAWFFVSPASGTAPASLSVLVNPEGLPSGSYGGAITISQTGASTAPITIGVTLTIQPARPAVAAVTNAASFREGPVAPGEFVTLFGSGMGPADLVTLRVTPAGFVDNVLAGARVWFDDMAAPLIHVSSGQVSAIVPYAAAGKSSVRMELEYRGVRSTPRDLAVAPSAPGLFTSDSSGRGQGAILNQDGTLNSPANGAAPGSFVSLFATGEGQTEPPAVDGALTTEPYPKPRLPVWVRIGGQEAEIQYAGAAPTLPAGVLQVNARVPSDILPGAAEILLRVGQTDSQTRVTLSVAR